MAETDRPALVATLRAALDAAETLAAPPPEVPRARDLAAHLADPVEFLVIGPQDTALEAIRFLAGLDNAFPRDLAAFVACLCLTHGTRRETVAVSGEGSVIPVPDEPIMLAPHAPVTLTCQVPNPILQRLRLSHMRNLTAAPDDPLRQARVAQADALLWISDAATPWTEAEDALHLSLPARLTDNAILLLTDAARVTDNAGLRARFTAKAERLNDRFRALVPLALPEALQAAPGGVLTDVALFNASGAHGLLHAVHALQERIQAQKDDEAGQLLHSLSAAVDAARAPVPPDSTPVAAPDPAPDPAAAPTALRPDETALAILREEAEFEADARRREAAGRGVPDDTEAPPPLPIAVCDDPALDDPASGDLPDPDSLTDFLQACACAHHAQDFDRADPIRRRQAFDGLQDMVTGLSSRLRDAPSGIRDRDRLLEDLEEAEDLLMLLSCEADDAALTDSADLVTQLLGDLFDRQPENVSEQGRVVAKFSP